MRFSVHQPTVKCYFFCLIFFSVLVTYAQNDSAYLIKKNGIYTGMASYYAQKFVGKRTATGEVFSQVKLTAACNILPLGTRVKVTNLKNNKSVIVRINDRLHARNKRLIDLTITAAKKLDFIKSGLAKVKIEKLDNYLR